jgi:putative glutamine amidotransferase
MKAVIIGVTPFFRHNKDEICLKEAVIMPLVELGANPVILPLVPDEKNAINFLDCIDGLVVSGSIHTIDARIYRCENKANNPYGISPYKNGEISLIQEAISKKIPILGICGGHQAINVACGGTLIQCIMHNVDDPLKHNFPESPRWYPVHNVSVSGYAEKLIGSKIQTNSLHDDAVGEIGHGIICSGKTSDGICEILESNNMGDKYILGVQFHPEWMKNGLCENIFGDFIGAAQKYKSSNQRSD